MNIFQLNVGKDRFLAEQGKHVRNILRLRLFTAGPVWKIQLGENTLKKYIFKKYSLEKYILEKEEYFASQIIHCSNRFAKIQFLHACVHACVRVCVCLLRACVCVCLLSVVCVQKLKNIQAYTMNS